MQDWRRLGDIVRATRSRRWRRQSDFARAAGISPRLLGDVENARRDNYEPESLSAIEAALGWTSGSVAAVLRGGRPTVEHDEALTRIMAVWHRLSPDARAMLAELAERTALR